VKTSRDQSTTLVAVTTSADRRTAEEVTFERLRMLGLGVLGGAVLLNGLRAPLSRLRAFRARVLERIDPLDTSGSTFVALVIDVLSLTDGNGPRTRK
jgi:hypothetical protein